MKLSFLYIQSGKETWSEEAEALYLKKLKAFCEFQILSVKSSSHDRDDKEKKKKLEGEKLLKQISSSAAVILLDEKGKDFKNSRDWAEKLQVQWESGRELVFLMGGAFGVSPAVKERANHIWKLSHLTFNHHVAKVVFLEQLYRGFTLIKGIPYHND